MANVFRLLEPKDIECRVGRTGRDEQGPWASVLLFKDARVDQRLMDETFGPMGWQDEYEMIDGMLFCRVSVWDEKKGCWISKMNVGTESGLEKEKGLASDALKRACFTWGLGVELYSAPKIIVRLRPGEWEMSYDQGGRPVVRTTPLLRLGVDRIEYGPDRKVSRLVLTDALGNVRYTYGVAQPPSAQPQAGASVFTAGDGSRLVKGGRTWLRAVEQTARGEVCEDGTPIPVFLADYYRIPDEQMREFFESVSQARDSISGQINS